MRLAARRIGYVAAILILHEGGKSLRRPMSVDPCIAGQHVGQFMDNGRSFGGDAVQDNRAAPVIAARNTPAVFESDSDRKYFGAQRDAQFLQGRESGVQFSDHSRDMIVGQTRLIID